MGESKTASVGNLSLNLDTFRVTVGGKTVEFTYSEFELLKLFMGELDRIIPYDTLARALWNTTGRTRQLNVMVFRLRSKIVESQPYRIETVRGRGYGLLKAREA